MESMEGMSDAYRKGLAHELGDADRAAAAPYVSYPATPWWHPPAFGAWFAAFLATFTWWSEDSGLLPGLALLALIAIELGYLTWMQRRHGAMPWPGRGTPPPEIARLWRRYYLGGLVVVAVVALVWWQVGVLTAAIAVFVLVTAGLTWYERSYEAAAAAVRARLR